MRHLIRDLELVDYLEGNLTKKEIRDLKSRLKENGETDMLYNLQLSYEKGCEEYANELLGQDDFDIDLPEETIQYGKVRPLFNPDTHLAAACIAYKDEATESTNKGYVRNKEKDKDGKK